MADRKIEYAKELWELAVTDASDPAVLTRIKEAEYQLKDLAADTFFAALRLAEVAGDAIPILDGVEEHVGESPDRWIQRADDVATRLVEALTAFLALLPEPPEGGGEVGEVTITTTCTHRSLYVFGTASQGGWMCENCGEVTERWRTK